MQKIVIIKLGADGDVLRTIPLVEAIKNKYPDSNITWVTRPSISEMLVGLPFVTRVLIMPCVIDESFDFLYNFDMETEATELAVKIDAKRNMGSTAKAIIPRRSILERNIILILYLMMLLRRAINALTRI